jgi:hypothetical protein
MLTKEQLEKAARYNARRYGGAIGSLDEYALLTATYQAKHGLTIDGMCGPKTEASLAKQVSCIETITTTSQQFIVNGAAVDVPFSGYTFTNYEVDKEPTFAASARHPTDRVDFCVLHETCGTTKQGCIDTLERKQHLGVHFILDPDGNWSQHGDPTLHYMAHAGPMNDCSFGVEIVNPYAPQFNDKPEVFSDWVRSRWWTWTPCEPRYVMPTKAQLASLALVLPWLCNVTGVPYEFPTSVLNRKMSRLNAPDLKRSYSGVVAHRDFEPNRSDGRYPLEYLEARHG